MRSVFFISDQTGITTEKLGNALLGKFPQLQFRKENIPFVDTTARVNFALAKIKDHYTQDGEHPIVVTSIINPELRDLFRVEWICHLDFFEAFIGKLEQELHAPATLKINKVHGIGDEQKYQRRIEAIHFSLENDDGVSAKNYAESDIIIIGVSRVGKTPTAIYLAVNYGVKAANYPLAEMDLFHEQLPKVLLPYQNKLFGLTIDPNRLNQIRQNRLPGTVYADMSTCTNEVYHAEQIMHKYQIPFLDTSKKSIEEIAVAIMQLIKIIE